MCEYIGHSFQIPLLRLAILQISPCDPQRADRPFIRYLTISDRSREHVRFIATPNHEGQTCPSLSHYEEALEITFRRFDYSRL